MADKEVDAGTQSQDGSQTNDNAMDKFQGFAVKDGEVQPASKPTVQNANAKPMKAAKAADGEGGEAEGADDKADKQRSADKRISQAVGRQRAAERRAEAAEARATANETRLAALEARLTGGGAQNKADKAPDVKDYEGGEYDARYLADVARFEARQEVAKATNTVRAESTTAAQTAEQQRIQREFVARRDEFFEAAAEKYDDFEDVVADPEVPVSPTVGELAMDSEYGAQILYELASDLKEAGKVHKMSVARQAAWFGRREAELSSGSSDADTGGEGDGEGEQTQRQSGPRSKVTKAPPVPEYNARGTGAVPKVSAATPDFASFERMAMSGKKK